MSKEK